jgi:hypothetical protein
MTLGPVQWEQCVNDAIVKIKVKQDDEILTLPSCNVCWKEAIDNKYIEIIEVLPLEVNDDN